MGSLDVKRVSFALPSDSSDLEKNSSAIIPTTDVSSKEFHDKEFKHTFTCNNELKFQAQKLPQWFAVISAQIGGFALGAIWFWTSTGLPDLARSGELGEVTKSDKAWITSILQLGALAVCPLTGFCMSRLGRRATMLWSNIPFAGGCILIGMAQSMWVIYLGRFIVGACSGIYGQIIPVYVSEACQPEIRGTLVCMFEIMISLGVLFIYVVGAVVSWRIQVFICAVIPIIGFIALWMVPESPYFFMERNRDKEAGEALRWLRGASSVEQVSQELQEISICVRRTSSSSPQGGWRVLKDFSILKPILLSMGLMTFFHGSFINAILAASVEIFQTAGDVDEYLCTIIIGTTQLIATMIPILISDKFGRKVLFMISLGLLVLSMSILGLYFHYKDNFGESYVSQWYWVPLASLMLYMIATSVGIVPLSWVVMGEITPPRAKGLAVTIISIWNRTVAFIVVYIFWDMLEVLGNDGTYWTIAAIGILAAIFIATFIPETKGKTLDQIQLHFIRRKSKTTKM